MTENYNVKAVDDGYGDVKFDSNGIPALVPSFVTSFKEKPVDEFANQNKDLKYIAAEIEGRRYVLGDYAMKLDVNPNWIGGENKHTDYRFPVMLKTALGLMTTGPHEVIDILMMNLPIRYDTPERRKVLQSITEGTHEVSISHDGHHFIRKAITVENVVIKKQPFGSLCDVILDGNGEIVDKQLAKGFNVIVDVGARTLNILTVDALEEQPGLTIQTNDGMFVPYIQIGDYLENELGVMIPDGKLPGIIGAKEIKGRDISPLIDQAYQQHANNILTILDKVLINSWGFVTSVIFTGGGVEVLKPYLEQAAQRTNTLFLGRFNTVRGLRKYGLRTAKKTIRRPTGGIVAKVGSRYESRD
jgi:plasmid segregation protein ParM